MSEREPEKQEGPRSFARFLEQLGDGGVHAELSGELHELTSHLQDLAANRSSKASGELNFRLKIEVMPNGVANIKHDIVTKKPKAQRNESVAWVTPKGGNLIFENPRQTKLPLVEVAGTKEAPRDIPAEERLRAVEV